MSFYDSASRDKLGRLIRSQPEVEQGWRRLADAMSAIDSAYLTDVSGQLQHMRDRVAQYGGNKKFTLGNYVREKAREAHALAFYYHQQQEPEAARHALELILLLCEEEQWLYQGGRRNSDLWTADIGVHLAMAYDTVRGTLDAGTRSRIENELLRKAFLPLYEDWLDPVKKLHALDTMGHNWWSVCVAGAGIVMLVLGPEQNGYAHYLHAVVEGLKEWFAYPGNVLQNKKANFGPDGDYIETMSYLDYALASFVPFEEYYRRRTGSRELLELPVLGRIPDAYLSTVYRMDGQIYSFGFGDVGDRYGHSHVWLMLADHFRRKDMLSFFHAWKEAPASPFELYFYPEGLPREPYEEKRELAVLAHSGYAVMRNDPDSEDGTVFAIKTGESWNHNHLDVGSFLLFSGGCEFIVDSGYCVYSKPLYNSYYRQSRAHNVVLLDGEGQPPEMIEFGTKFEGSIPVRLDTPDYRYLLADCTGPYMHLYHRFYRHILMLDGFLIMTDDLFASRDGAFEWLLHYDGEASAARETITIRQKAKELRVHHVYPEAKTYSTEKGYKSSFHRSTGREDDFPEAAYFKIRAESKDRRIKYMTVFELPGEKRRLREIRKLTNEQFQGLRLIEVTGAYTDILCNLHADGRVMHDNAHGSFAGVETDAFLCSVRYDSSGRLERASVHNGSYLKVDGSCLFSTLLKADVLLDYRSGLDCWTSLTADAWCSFAYNGGAAEDLLHDPVSQLWRKKLLKGSGHFHLNSC
ncbi:Heparinase II/III-like protein [Paenibacillus sp. UNCCL117]|uniref:heparinase II/III family protein n=1 Tax=unclassified Paenibacillus TaxID=185978 RepID=UPI000882EC5C|nr:MULTISPECIES: heparinase II/III-family protein [unclassified Paenibacillus]SDD63812.1 Heparinase II/III-like protein [Paenibacillus sp. cl123]SFW58445.1 Heparinase II/III-like protein [Paenibacillus sp. UNCCL117]